MFSVHAPQWHYDVSFVNAPPGESAVLCRCTADMWCQQAALHWVLCFVLFLVLDWILGLADCYHESSNPCENETGMWMLSCTWPDYWALDLSVLGGLEVFVGYSGYYASKVQNFN